MIAAALSAAYRDRDPQDPSDGVLVPTLMGWAAFCLFPSRGRSSFSGGLSGREETVIPARE